MRIACNFIHLFFSVIYSKHLFINWEEIVAKFPICLKSFMEFVISVSVCGCIGIMRS